MAFSQGTAVLTRLALQRLPRPPNYYCSGRDYIFLGFRRVVEVNDGRYDAGDSFDG